MKQVEIKTVDMSHLLIVSLRESLTIEHYFSIPEIIESAFFEIPEIDNMILTDNEGEILGQKRRGRDLISNNNVTVDNTICIGDNILGFLTVTYNTDSLHKEIFDQIFVSSAIGLLGIALSSIVLFNVMSKITTVIHDVNSNVELMIEGNKPEIIISQRSDELGDLVNNYNKLVDAITHKK